jgi:hypothetical protein
MKLGTAAVIIMMRRPERTVHDLFLNIHSISEPLYGIILIIEF